MPTKLDIGRPRSGSIGSGHARAPHRRHHGSAIMRNWRYRVLMAMRIYDAYQTHRIDAASRANSYAPWPSKRRHSLKHIHLGHIHREGCLLAESTSSNVRLSWRDALASPSIGMKRATRALSPIHFAIITIISCFDILIINRRPIYYYMIIGEAFIHYHTAASLIGASRLLIFFI